jgi:hypothetical protein
MGHTVKRNGQKSRKEDRVDPPHRDVEDDRVGVGPLGDLRGGLQQDAD